MTFAQELYGFMRSIVSGKLLLAMKTEMCKCFFYESMLAHPQSWQLLLNMGKFEEALQHCGGDIAKKDKVKSAQADHFFQHKKYELAAKIYGQTQQSFEDICLKFIKIGTSF